MPKTWLLGALVTGLVSLAASAEAHGPGHARPEQTCVVQILPGQHLPRLGRQGAPWPEAGVIPGHRHPTPGALETPWHYTTPRSTARRPTACGPTIAIACRPQSVRSCRWS